MNARPAFVATLVIATATACSSGDRGPSTERPATNEDKSLGGEIAARVGAQAIPLALVADVAAARKLDPHEAALRLIDDEIAASAARAHGLDRAVPGAWKLVAARGRFTSEHIFTEAKRRGPPTDEEVAFLSERHWSEVDRPPTVRVVHALVFRPENKALEPRARELAKELRRALLEVPNDQFEATASAFAHDPAFKTRAEKLPPFTSDGRVIEGGQMDPAFATGAAALAEVGETSQVVESSFGFHVIRLLERLPEKRMPLELRRLAFAEEVYSLRARDILTARLKELRAGHPVVVAEAAETLMRSVTVATSEPSREHAGAP